MSFNYTSLQNSASDLLEKFGRLLTFTRVTDGTFNPETGSKTQTEETYQKYACVFDYTAQEIALDNIEVGDRRLLAEGHTYEVGDTVVLDSQSYRVVAVSNVQPAGTIIACNLQVRK